MFGRMALEENKKLDSLVQDFSQVKLDHDLLTTSEENFRTEAKRCKKELLASEEMWTEKKKGL